MQLIYTDIYFDLLSQLRKDQEFDNVLRKIFLGCFLLNIYAAFILGTRVIIPVSISVYVGAMSVSPMMFILFGSTLRLIVAMWIGSNNGNTVAEIASWLLVGVRQPYGDSYGLNWSHINELKQIANVEQNAADWRGNAIGFVWALLLFFILEIPQFILDFFNQLQVNNVPEWYASPLPALPILETLNNISYVLSILFALVILLFLLERTFRYFVDFLGSESSNRTIILACLEAQCLLKNNALQNLDKVGEGNKRMLIYKLGFYLRPVSSITDSKLLEFQQGKQAYRLCRLKSRAWYRRLRFWESRKQARIS